MDNATYTMLRQFADSWGLAFMFVFFAVAIGFVLLNPRASANARNAAAIPFKEDHVDGE
ncbi:cbb3-type cytochrome c oxidase subunit 3 [Consotaella salsifontis]|uniref:Cytochrome c oxidase cbb3-type subunit 4 n=1 Tax=Consotaella salsifontis TaxID=1365950 RepID=A0A1T4SWD3_9HYPH|nr:cbb3-type cytochrome c oxidase subunit 3 [Consotaella salsifontis]SKA32574.1 cytochrome c oxidase cbb3-type subunit 4 [Consotaella salsifontis]